MKRKATTPKSRPTKKAKTVLVAVAAPKPKLRRGVTIAPELKFNDNTFNTDATTTGTVASINAFAAGDTALTRDGNKIQMKSVEVRYKMELEALAVNAFVRVLVVYDRQPNGTAPSIATAGTGPLETITITSMRQVASMSRFKVLSDKVYDLNNQSDTAGATFKCSDHIYIKLPEDCRPAAFADGTAASPISGGLYLMYFSDIAAGATDVNFDGVTRLRFWG